MIQKSFLIIVLLVGTFVLLPMFGLDRSMLHRIKNHDDLKMTTIQMTTIVENNNDTYTEKPICKENIPLEFIHIPKTAGTTIEDIGISKNYCWGRFNEIKPKNLVADQFCSDWHLPPSHPNVAIRYENVTTFCVVRHPLHRMVSEYSYFFNQKFKEGNNTISFNQKFKIRNNTNGAADWCDPDVFNTFISHFFINLKTSPVYNGHNHNNCHFVKQMEYVKDCDRILHFENLEQEFNDLMEEFNVDLKLDLHANKKAHCNIGASDLSDTARDFLNEFYKDDFEGLNYAFDYEGYMRF